jgi:CheY-like chemotaxis protein
MRRWDGKRSTRGSDVSGKILVVDDNTTNLRLMRVVLETQNYEVYEAFDAGQAVKVLEDIVPVLILMDITMPGMDGLTLTRQLKANPRFKAIPIVAVSSLAMKGDDQKALAAGCDAYITKPIDTRQLPVQVLQWIRSGSKNT